HQQWAKEMKTLLIDIAKAVENAGGWLPSDEAERCRKRYRKLLEKAEIECLPPDESQRTSVSSRSRNVYQTASG
ncbi:MAG: IS66 family transposase, partial [Candidatus Thiodiazotropha sp. (ex Lucinoma aequizonata)]|nr:IS66 family transposase [Candidatus Thiodiazotropha sp. (ex Lucinoma aequizonata)]MCU7894931.1 IS66 family transposase [Candidatus Thiodiazotropha sp. (ex Lucinoma aequizonata)]